MLWNPPQHAERNLLKGIEMSNLYIKGEDWLKEQFEHEYCAECGGDAEHHTAKSFLYNWFAWCDYPPDENESLHDVILDMRYEFDPDFRHEDPN